MSLFAACESLTLPTQCVGCGRWDTGLCDECAALSGRFPDGWAILDGDGDDLPMWTLGDYEGSLRRILLAAKHRDRADTDAFLWRAGRTLGLSMSRSRMMGGAEDIWVVPAPSRWRRRWNGREVACVIAHGVARGIYEGCGVRVRLVQACALRWGAGTQAGRSGAERRRGRAGTMRCRLTVPPQVGVVLVDDVVTTGATIREMSRVMNARIVGVGALCHVAR